MAPSGLLDAPAPTRPQRFGCLLLAMAERAGVTAGGAPGVVRVFEEDPGLLHGLEEREADRARREGVARAIRVAPGRWTLPGRQPPVMAGHLGLLIVDGLIARTTSIGTTRCPELLGVGDLLRPWPWQEESRVASMPYESWLDVLEPATVAVLDARFAAVVCRWPSVIGALLERTTERARWLALQVAIGHLRRVDARVLVLLWHLADRWGRVRSDGVHVPIRLTHAYLARLIGAQRPSVTLALSELRAAGRVRRERDGTWVLRTPPPDLTALTPRTSARAPGGVSGG